MLKNIMENQNNFKNQQNNNNLNYNNINSVNNFVNNNDNENDNNDNYSSLEDNEISLIFKGNTRENRNERFTISCKKNELLKDVIKRYCSKIKVNENELIFLYDCHQLVKEKTVDEFGLINGSIILVVNAKGMKGGKISIK